MPGDLWLYTGMYTFHNESHGFSINLNRAEDSIPLDCSMSFGFTSNPNLRLQINQVLFGFSDPSGQFSVEDFRPEHFSEMSILVSGFGRNMETLDFFEVEFTGTVDTIHSVADSGTTLVMLVVGLLLIALVKPIQ